MHPQGSASGPARLRTSDAERETVAEIVRAAMAEGRLDLVEGEERLTMAGIAQLAGEIRGKERGVIMAGDIGE